MAADLYEFAWPEKFDDGYIRLRHPIEGEFETEEFVSLVGDGDPSFIGRGYTTVEEETGIGLRVGKEVIDLHGWEIAITRGTSDGARFEITGIGGEPP